MKRLHVHISVPDLNKAILFYNQMFGEVPTKQKTDYAKWQLEDPAVNFAISTHCEKIGLDHLGLQVSGEDELQTLNNRLSNADIETGKVESTTCCYAESIKSWSFDPAGIPWEGFMTMKDAEIYGTDSADMPGQQNACCSGTAPQLSAGSSCC
ncbi:MAG: glyoxalase/bleomycin resistance/dioxygenase family protein [Gammaproteobacteria bacterium]|jgi:hypothetical protein|nr:glyoxalase/bleomycin resistance/dioxygenase family protein [Gammaproteobacteria bacterium]MBT6552586.1 glyoxalase/bleomycin resistance/dioxygenase family protein [Gammaproteobacteria bacterium]MBT7208009.1 glyoxalase/bleomycin resistance/dioxygenase family protein [Gammaproteobacteria bacterium]